jgi:hypothetical protein
MFYHLQDESECGRENIGDITKFGENIHKNYKEFLLVLFCL